MAQFTDVTEAAIAVLIDRFYDKVRRDPAIGPVFNAAIDDWDKHLAKLKAFWSSVMLTSGSYRGNPMARHMTQPIEPRHFGRWLELWRETVAELFVPAVAARFAEKAERIGESLKLALFFRPDAAAAVQRRNPSDDG